MIEKMKNDEMTTPKAGRILAEKKMENTAEPNGSIEEDKGCLQAGKKQILNIIDERCLTNGYEWAW